MSTDVDPALETLLEYIKTERGFDFTGYKRPSLTRRIGRRMDELGIEDYERYLDRLQADPDEFTALFNTILINLTSFFRDGPVWDLIETELLPRLLSGKSRAAPVRVWCAGCATGEEAYSIAMLLAAELGAEAFADRVKIFATDVDEDALRIARQGWYTDKALQAIPQRFADLSFVRENGGGSFVPEIRRSVIFGRHDLVQDAPISRTDLLLCRNTIMYMNSGTQQRVIDTLAFSLNEGGFLVLGKSEMLFSKLRSFAPLDLKRRVFVKIEGDGERQGRRLEERAEGHQEADALSERLAFDLGPVAEIVIDSEGNLVQANRRARDMLGIRRQDLGKEFHRLESSYRPVELRSPIEQAQKTGRVMALGGIGTTDPGGSDRIIDVLVIPLMKGDESHGAVVTFTDVTEFHRLRVDVERSTQELETAMEELQSTNEELETTNEELQSSNEELETTNEELQSSNEELETTNEELHSSNEELETMNEELQQRTLELAEANHFTETVMGSLGAGVIVVGDDQRIRAWNRESEAMWGLRESEVRGQPLRELDVGLAIGRLVDLAEATLAGKDPGDLVLDARDRRGVAFRCRVSASTLADPASAEGDGAILVVRREPGDADLG